MDEFFFAILWAMEELQKSFPPDYKVEEAAYQKILSSERQVSHNLPAWETEADRWSKYVESWKQAIEEFLSKHLKTDKKLDLSWINWEWVVITIAIVVSLSVVALIVYIISSYLRGKSEDLRFKEKLPMIEITNRETRLVTLIQEMMAKGEWSTAARLRWRLFLERKNLASQTTPLEFEQKESTSLPKALEQYEKMFDSPKGDQNWYQSYAKTLKELEGSQ